MNFNNIDIEPIFGSKNIINDIFDKNGFELYEHLKNKFIFLFSFYNQKVPAIHLNELCNTAEIFVPKNSKIIKPLFTHELLHLNLLANGINNKKAIIDCITNNRLPEVFNMATEDIMFTYNFLDHFIIYHDFKRMGYIDDVFVADYNENRFNKIVETYLEYSFHTTRPDDRAKSFYISKYIGLRAPICQIKNYSEAFNKMKNLYTPLYNICKSFVDKYENISKENYDIIHEKYYKVIDDFIIGLKTILSKK